ncbi:MAG: hypothetical protein K1W11_04585, partial [Akkermansia muciniphila]
FPGKAALLRPESGGRYQGWMNERRFFSVPGIVEILPFNKDASLGIFISDFPVFRLLLHFLSQEV